jgi:hypothetical protein
MRSQDYSSVRTLVAGVALVLPLVACQSNDGKSNPVTAAVQALKATDLQGNWQSGCISSIAGGLFGHERKRIELAGDKAIFVTEGSAPSIAGAILTPDKSPCADPIGEVREEGSFDTGGDAQGGHKIQFKIEKVSLKANGDLGAKALNVINACGINDWKAGESRDVTKATQEGSIKCWGDKTPFTLYDIYTIEGTRLFLGKGQERGKESEDGRPRDLDREMAFDKQ